MTDQNSQPIVLAVLRAVGARGTESGGYSRPPLAYSNAQIDAAVDELRRGGYLEAVLIGRAFGDNPAHWEPSILTVRGRKLLEDLERKS